VGWYQLNFLAGGIFTLLAGLFVFYHGGPRRATQNTWFLLCLFTSLWHFGRFFAGISNSPAVAERAVYLIYAAAIFIPPFFLHFILSLLDEEKKQRVPLIAAYCTGLVEVVLLIFGQLTQGVRVYQNLGFYEVPTRLYLLHFLAFVVYPSYALLRLIRTYRKSNLAIRNNQLKYVIFASLIGFLGGGTSFFPLMDSPLPPYGAPLTYFYTFPIAYAIARYRLLDIHIVVKRSLIYTLLLLLLLVPCYLLVMLSQVLAFGQVHFGFSLVTLVLLVMVGFFFPKLRFRTEGALERVLFKKRYDYRETLLRSSKDMISVVNLETLANKLVRTVSTVLNIEKASLYLVDETQGYFEVKSVTNPTPGEFNELRLLRDDPLVQRLIRRPETLVREELEFSQNGNRAQKDVASRMGQLEAEVSLPLITQERLIGILNLGHKEGREIYSNEDFEVLVTLANQAAIAIENARLYDNLRQSQRVLQRADRLSSLGMLTAGLAHEIRNPLVAIRTFTQLLPERYQDADFRTNFQSLALKEVDRICNLITDLLSFARPSTPNVSTENINEIIENVARILETGAKERDVKIQLRLSSDLPAIFVDKEQMKQVFMNLILNAIQSIEGGGLVEISSRLFVSSDSHKFVQIRVYDSGIGIPEKDIENIFNPFFTTKKGGSGLGLSISHQIVQEHAGYMAVESKVGHGTSFYINLPVSALAQKESRGFPELHEKDSGR
jgi:signal transduction histidine kinase